MKIITRAIVTLLSLLLISAGLYVTFAIGLTSLKEGGGDAMGYLLCIALILSGGLLLRKAFKK
ncbi:MAG TPA: hypothetical protein VF691_07615 [Cytophagaceae bacterium]|jgi:hypothetical protein